ncbi:MAG TPA: glycerol-3-phosphate 1-O-acyltransferase PlsY [Verrucomicrobiales bacterium]|jgi:glycerol-3-phosphate acyltransferase PlsY|nr:glycerol-3-phosphate 1-O-acyltransferase PlsY [Verrucomicrobiales bacterium]
MTSSEAIACLVATLAAYVIGATPFGYFAGRMRGIDIREHGSGNIGATNVFRVLGRRVGIPVFILDMLKGFLPVIITRSVLAERGIPYDWAEIGAAVGAVLGHNFTFWLHFRGGKGIATSAGGLLALLPIPLAAALSAWLILFYSTRYVAVASIAASIMVPTATIVMYLLNAGIPKVPQLPLVGFSLLIGLLAVWRHRSNIRRLMNGTENRFARKQPPASTAS